MRNVPSTSMSVSMAVFVLYAAMLCATPAARATTPLEDWRAGVAQTRALAENDAPAAYASAQQLRAQIPPDATQADQARSLNLLSRTEIYVAQTDAAARHAEQAFELATQAGDKVGQAEADLNVALTSVNQGRIDLLITATSRSLSELDGVDQPSLLGESFLRTAMMYRRIGQLEESVAMAMHAMEIARRTNDPMALTYAHQGLAISFDQSFRYKEARDHYVQMRDQAIAAHSKQMEAYATLGLGSATAALGDAAGGERHIRAAMRLFRETGAPFGINFGLTQLAHNLRLQGRFREAQPMLDQVVETYDKYPNRIGLWYGLNSRSVNLQSLGDLRGARADAERAHAIAKDIGFALYVSESAHRRSVLAAADGDYRQAYELASEASDMTAQAAREKSSARMLELAQRYLAESKQREIDRLTARNLQQTNELERQRSRQRWLGSVLLGSVAALALLSYLFIRLRGFQADLRQQRAILQSVLDSMADGVSVANAEGELIIVNPMAERILGMGLRPGGVQVWPDRYGLYLPDQVTTYPAADQPLARGLAGESVDNVEMFVRNAARPEGCWLNVTARPLTDQAGVASGAVAVFSDVTARKRSDAALRQREQEFRALVEHTPDFVSRFDIDCRRIYANPALALALGIPVDSLLGARPSELIGMPPEQALVYDAQVREVLASGVDASIGIALRASETSTISYQVRLVAERDEQGQVVSVMAIGRDVTEMMDTQRRLQALLENLPDMVARFDRQGRYLYTNPALPKAFGIPFERFIGRTNQELGLDPAGLMCAALARTIEAARPDLLEIPWVGPDGQRFFEVRHVPEMDVRGEVGSVLCIVREVTERRRTEALVRDLGFRREAAREDERRYIARELHDELGQTLSALRLEISVLRMRGGVDGQSLALKASGMLALVDSVIQVQRNLVSSLRPAVLDMGIGTALEWLVGELQEHSGIQCELCMTESMLELDSDQTVMVFRIVQESLTNVSRHAQASRVEVRLDRREDCYSLAIQDDGIGFDPTATRSPKSFGLIGLSERAQMLGGQIDIRSSAEGGTRVAVKFPATGAVLARET